MLIETRKLLRIEFWVLLPLVLLVGALVVAFFASLPAQKQGDERAWTLASQACDQIKVGDSHDSVRKLGERSGAEISESDEVIALHYRYSFMGDRPGCLVGIEEGRVSDTRFDFP